MTHPLTFVQYDALIARLRELRDAPEPDVAMLRTDEEYAEAMEVWRAQQDLAIELLAMLGEE